mmetsp:Transcript_4114/g.4748  ORF Transcript_4114/g.4748 Transcript_4114/m.4748 type:complete len:173 (-) Transcript_4114:19-537(-)
MNVELEDILAKSIPCTLKGYKRAFAGASDVFGEKGRSVCTILKDDQAEIKSYAFEVEDQNMKFIDEFEAYPVMYDRIVMQCESTQGEVFDAFVYIMNDISKYAYPTEGYLKGVAQTIASHYYLSKQTFDFENVVIEIVKADGEEIIRNHTVKMGIEEYPELIKNQIAEIISS